MSNAAARARLDDLLVQQATEGLTVAERAELERLLAQHPSCDAEALDRAAAAVHVAAVGEAEAMPGHLSALIESSARRRLAGGDGD